MILSLIHENIQEQTIYYTFNLIEGYVVCTNGSVAFESIKAVTLYSDSDSLIFGTKLYSNQALTVLAPFGGVKDGVIDVYELTDGIIDVVKVIGDDC